jgi:small nuclear ribonucleoprotein (snRNP)-like protein
MTETVICYLMLPKCIYHLDCNMWGTSKHTGTLVGFDYHMNLLLRDVKETYTVLLKVCRIIPARDSGDSPPTPLSPSVSVSGGSY